MYRLEPILAKKMRNHLLEKKRMITFACNKKATIWQ